MIYVTADLHLGHKNICLGTSEWIDKVKSCRKFDNPDQMYDAIVKSINDRCMEDDTLIIAGDVFFGSDYIFYKFMGDIIPNKIIITLGNHDKWIEKHSNILENKNFSICDRCGFSLDDRSYIEIHHYPPLPSYVSDHKNNILIHGHSHHNLDNDLMHRMNKNIIDVGWDGDIYSLDEIISKSANANRILMDLRRNYLLFWVNEKWFIKYI